MLPFRIPLNNWVDSFVNFLRDALGPFFDGFRALLAAILSNLLALFEFAPAIVVIALIVLVAWLVAGRGVAIFSLIGLVIIENIGLWGPFLSTLALVITAEILILAIGLPLGILAGSSDSVERVMRPILDFMQTMPAFVYLIPTLMLFRLGNPPGVIATFIFAIPPLIRLTSLGIRQVPADLIEASEAFGSTQMQKLFKVQLPVALPTVMAGVNQSIMLNLSMIVIASMIGAGGLGSEVLRAIQRIQIGNGFEAGLAVVIMAIILDRITASLGKSTNVKGK